MMHDWTLSTISVDWATGEVCLVFQMADGTRIVNGHGVSSLHVPRALDWGPSVSVNELVGPDPMNDGMRIAFEMQSGDVIEIVAKSFDLPEDLGAHISSMETST